MSSVASKISATKEGVSEYIVWSERRERVEEGRIQHTN